MKLIPNWRRAWRLFSVQAMAFAAAIQGTWPTIPADMKSSIPAGVVHWATMILLVVGIVGRLIAQPKVSDEP